MNDSLKKIFGFFYSIDKNSDRLKSLYEVNLMHGISIYCDFSDKLSSWIVLMRRFSTYKNLDFNEKSLEKYKKGFGDLNGNFWLGLENMHILTKSNPYRKVTLWITLINRRNEVKIETLEDFSIGDSKSNYAIQGHGSSFLRPGFEFKKDSVYCFNDAVSYFWYAERNIDCSTLTGRNIEVLHRNYKDTEMKIKYSLKN